MKRPSLRAMQILGAIGVEFYCSRNAPGDPELESYIRQLWDVARTEDLPGWSADCTGLCDGLGARFATGKREHLRRLCNAAYEIAGSQMYSNYKPEQASRFLGEVGELAEVDLDSLALSDVFCRHAPGVDGWGDPVPQHVVQEWQKVARQICTT